MSLAGPSTCTHRRRSRFSAPRQLCPVSPEQQSAGCVQPWPVSPAHAATVRAASEARRRATHEQIGFLRPHLCRNALPFVSLVAVWLAWTVAAPCALLLPPHLGQGARGVGWAFLGTGVAYLLLMLAPIIHKGLLCMPRAPEDDGPWLREPLRLHDAQEGGEKNGAAKPDAADGVPVANGAIADAQANSGPHVLHPQPSSRRVMLRGRCVHVIYNSHGVHGASAKGKAEQCIERFRSEGACVHPLLTQYAGHLADLGRDPLLLPLGPTAADADGAGPGPGRAGSGSGSVALVVIVGGDGSMSEWVGGYLERCHAQKIAPADRTPVCLIPGGSGNSFARDLYSRVLDTQTAIESACNGCVKLVDVCMVRDQTGRVHASTNVVSWGLIGDTAVAAEGWRQLGDARYDLCALWFVARRITSRARFVVRHLVGAHNVLRGEPVRFVEDGPAAPTKGGPASPVAVAANNAGATTHSRSELVLGGEKTTAFFNCTQHFGKALRACPYARLDDGLVDVVVAEGGVERRHMLTMFRQLPAGSHLANGAISHFQAQRVLLQQMPLHDEGDEDDDGRGGAHERAAATPRPYVINIDGENVLVTGDLDIQCLSRQIPVCAPL